MKASPPGEVFHVRCSLDFPGPASEVHGVFINRNLPSTPGRQPTATASLKIWLKQKSFIYVAMQLAGIVWKSNSDYKILSVPRYCDTLHTFFFFGQEVWFPNGYLYNRYRVKVPSRKDHRKMEKTRTMKWFFLRESCYIWKTVFHSKGLFSLLLSVDLVSVYCYTWAETEGIVYVRVTTVNFNSFFSQLNVFYM